MRGVTFKAQSNNKSPVEIRSEDELQVCVLGQPCQTHHIKGHAGRRKENTHDAMRARQLRLLAVLLLEDRPDRLKELLVRLVRVLFYRHTRGTSAVSCVHSAKGEAGNEVTYSTTS